MTDLSRSFCPGSRAISRSLYFGLHVIDEHFSRWPSVLETAKNHAYSDACSGPHQHVLRAIQIICWLVLYLPCHVNFPITKLLTDRSMVRCINSFLAFTNIRESLWPLLEVLINHVLSGKTPATVKYVELIGTRIRPVPVEYRRRKSFRSSIFRTFANRLWHLEIPAKYATRPPQTAGEELISMHHKTVG